MDSYKVLDVSRDATVEEIRLAYKKLALKWHPDRHMTDKESAQQKFIEIHEAYRILTEKKERHRSKQTEDDPQGSGSSSTCSTTDSSTSPSSPAPSTSGHHGSDSYTTPLTSPSPSSSGSRSYSHGSSNPHTHGTPPSGTKSSGHARSSNHKSPRNPLSDSRTSPSGPRSGHGSSRHRSDRETPSSSKSRSSSNFKSHGSSGSKGGSDSRVRSRSSLSHDDHQPEPPSTPKSARTKLRKQSKPTLRRPDHTPRNPRTAQSVPFSPIHGSYPRGAGGSKEWRCPIKLTLEELFHGKCLRYRLTRYLLSNKKKHVIVDIDVPPGCRPGSKIICPGIGHERKDGSLQDIVFVIEEAPHARFCRLQKNGDDLGMDVKLPWVKALEREKGEVHFKGIDGKDISVKIDYPNDRHMEGTHVVVGAGMPIREGRDGKLTGRRGDLVVRWEIVTSPTSTWEALKQKVLHFKN